MPPLAIENGKACRMQLGQQLTSICNKRVARYPACPRRRQKKHHTGDLLWPTQPPQRNAGEHLIVASPVGVLASLPKTAGKFNRTRRNAVHADTAFRQGQRLRRGELNEGRLCCSVSWVPRGRSKAGDG